MTKNVDNIETREVHEEMQNQAAYHWIGAS